jgi:hypothetical protein
MNSCPSIKIESRRIELARLNENLQKGFISTILETILIQIRRGATHWFFAASQGIYMPSAEKRQKLERR